MFLTHYPCIPKFIRDVEILNLYLQGQSPRKVLRWMLVQERFQYDMSIQLLTISLQAEITTIDLNFA